MNAATPSLSDIHSPMKTERRTANGKFLLYLDPEFPNAEMSRDSETWLNNRITKLFKMLTLTKLHSEDPKQRLGVL
jgi:hypothetical protein